MAKNKANKKPSKIKKFFSKKRNVVIFVIVLVLLVGGGAAALMLINKDGGILDLSNDTSNKKENEDRVVKYYDDLTGELVSYSGYQKNADGSEKKDSDGNSIYISETQAKEQVDKNNLARINCIQIPNGTDARPQVGLSSAKIVYEAIAEGGITRFAALYRGSTDDVIGPIRSLRMYYLEWDIPYDCTIVHAGGVKAAVERAKSYAHLSESKTYMWRDYSGYYAPNNLFTSAELLDSFNRDNKYTDSRPKVFARLTPDESDAELKEIRTASTDESDENAKKYAYANSIYVHVTAAANYNVNYTYDSATNTYLRAYEGNSGKHMSYTCKNTGKSGNKIKPQKDCGAAKQVAPKVVVVMKVDEALNQENLYREEITTTGSGEAWVFQNGIAIEATWSRDKAESGLVFKDKQTGDEVKLAPGQTWITAIAKSYGYVKY